MSDDFVVKDSSCSSNGPTFSAVTATDPSIKMGFVQSSKYNANTGQTSYIVEVLVKGDRIMVPCVHASRFGGAYNYEDFGLHDYNTSEKSRTKFAYATKAGDAVVVAFIDGNSRGGVILGAVTHLSRKPTIKPIDGPQYLSEFNGIEKSINKDGEYITTFKGLPTNLAELNKEPTSIAIAAPKYDKEVGLTNVKFDKTGGWAVSDAASEKPQSIFLNKASGSIEVKSGALTLIFDKATETAKVTSKVFEVNSKDSVTFTTKAFKAEASGTIKISSPKIAIGKGGVELLDQLSKLVDALGNVAVMTPVGPTLPLIMGVGWAGVSAIKSQIDSIKGSL